MDDYLKHFIKAGLLNPQGQPWDMTKFDARNPYMGGSDGRNQRYFGSPLSQEKVQEYATRISDYYSKLDAWDRKQADLGKQGYVNNNTQEYMDFLKSQPEYIAARDANFSFDDLNKDIRSTMYGLMDKGTQAESQGARVVSQSLFPQRAHGFVEPTVRRKGFNIGRTLANIIGKNPWVMALPMLSAAAPALLGTGAATAGTAGAGAATAGTAGAGAASTGSTISSLLKGIASIPSQFSSLLGGGTIGDIGAGALRGAVIGGASSGLSGGNVGRGILSGALTGGVTGGVGSALQGTEVGDFFGIEPSVTSADNALVSKAQAGAGLPWSASGSPSVLKQLGGTLGLTGGGTSSMGTLSTLLGGANNYFANKKALKQLDNAGNDAMALLNPYISQGGASTSRLADLLGLSGRADAEGYGSLAKPFTPADLTTDPGYQFQLAEGQKALDRNASARGGYYSGAALKDAAKYAQNLADTTYNDAFTRDQQEKGRIYALLSGQQGVGYGAAGAGAGLTTDIGSAKANSTVRGANNINNTLASLLFGNGRGYNPYMLWG